MFTYCIPIDDGAAPNPFWGVCTLNICKPVIRRVAQVGDWVVGTGATLSRDRDLRGTVVYAMQVTQKMTMQEYDAYAKKELTGKIPACHHKDFKRRLGDSIYDFSTNPPKIRESVHDEGNRNRDLGGIYTLLSDHFFYFGDDARPLPDDLRPIVKDGQGHRSRSSSKYFEAFVDWIHNKESSQTNLIVILKSTCSKMRLRKCGVQSGGA